MAHERTAIGMSGIARKRSDARLSVCPSPTSTLQPYAWRRLNTSMLVCIDPPVLFFLVRCHSNHCRRCATSLFRLLRSSLVECFVWMHSREKSGRCVRKETFLSRQRTSPADAPMKRCASAKSRRFLAGNSKEHRIDFYIEMPGCKLRYQCNHQTPNKPHYTTFSIAHGCLSIKASFYVW